ncbi:MAG TPA: FAD-dependent oxidoreductase [Myxococcales bacterium]|nr:FAD-dependent oxidoreductase [Myxococcales bacterium]HIN86479.1 FAD-dependent oxidoreductase [Myxococcales bacterium]
MKIAVIGTGGAGMTSAWLLEQEHDVTVFERNPALGGHANTIEVERGGQMHYVDDGFSWFSAKMYPRYLRLLELAEQDTDKVKMTASFTDVQKGRSVFMPPVGFGRVFKLLCNPWGLTHLLRFNTAVKAAEELVAQQITDMTCRQYLDGLKVPKSFKDEFLEPFMSAVWGCPFERTLDCAVYPLMKYNVLHRPAALSYYEWQVVSGGANAYIRKLAALLERATIHVDSPVQRIEKTDSGFIVDSAKTGPLPFDQVVVASGARDALALVSNTLGVEPALQALAKFEYYSARVATHSDDKYMPPNRSHWAVGNVRYDGQSADMTIWHGRNTGQSVFATYVQETLPEETHNLSVFWLPLETPRHFDGQNALKAVQGQQGLWFAGDYTQDIGSHEDAISSAISIAEKLAPKSARLAQIKQDAAA